MSNCICIDVEYDEVETVLRDEMPRARIPHKCGECGETIQPGRLYERIVTAYDGTINTHKTCARCVNIRREYFKCGWYWGRLVDDFRNAHDFDYRDGIHQGFAPCETA